MSGCRFYYPDDPNARTIVTSKYLDEEPKIIMPPGAPCTKQIDCSDKTKAECSVALYNDAIKIMEEGLRLEDKKMYVSAKLEYMIALCRLSAAEILYKQANTETFEDFKLIQTFKLEKKIEIKIKKCESKILTLGWKQL